jgi:hypothetical protein
VYPSRGDPIQHGLEQRLALRSFRTPFLHRDPILSSLEPRSTLQIDRTYLPLMIPMIERNQIVSARAKAARKGTGSMFP